MGNEHGSLVKPESLPCGVSRMHASAVMCLKSSFGRSVYSACPGAVTRVLYHCVLSRTLQLVTESLSCHKGGVS